MKLIINHSSQQPIYEQIAEQIKASVINGAVREGEMLPSVRSLSKDLKISALTVKRPMTRWNMRGLSIQSTEKAALSREPAPSF